MRTQYWRVLSGVEIALACVTCLFPSRANALTCATNWVRAPSSGATDVPTNTRLWGIGSRDSTRLIGRTGAVELEQRYLRVAGNATEATLLSLLVPTRELEPNSRYTVEIDWGETDPIERMRFVTGPGPALQSPLIPELLSNEPRAGDVLSGGERYRALEFSHGPIIIGDANGALGALSSITEIELTEILPERQPLEPASPIVRWATSDSEQGDDGPALLSQCAMAPRTRDDASRFSTGALLALGVVLALRRRRQTAEARFILKLTTRASRQPRRPPAGHRAQSTSSK